MGVSLPGIVIFGVLMVAFGIAVAVFFTSRVMPEQASLQAQNTDGLFAVLLAIGAMVFFLVQGLLVISVVRYRHRLTDLSDGPNVHGNTTLEIVWTIIPAVIVVFLAIYSFIVWSTNNAPRENENLVNGETIAINALGQQFAWNFEYVSNVSLTTEEASALRVQDDGSAAPQNVSFTTRDLHVYAGQHVALDMQTADVIHSFWVPAMRVKQDLLPGRTTTIRFSPIATDEGFPFTVLSGPVETYVAPDANSEIFRTVSEGGSVEVRVVDEVPGQPFMRIQFNDTGSEAYVDSAAIGNRYAKYRLICTELCGSGHGEMFSYLIVHPDEATYLQAFYDQQVEAVLNPPADPVLLGERVINNYACSGCHVLESQGWNGQSGPSLNGIADRAASRAAAAGVATGAEYLVQSMRQPQAYNVPGAWSVVMPVHAPQDGVPGATTMSQDELEGIVAYLCTQTVSGDPADSTCGLDNWEFGPDGQLTSPEPVIEQLEQISDPYQ